MLNELNFCPVASANCASFWVSAIASPTPILPNPAFWIKFSKPWRILPVKPNSFLTRLDTSTNSFWAAIASSAASTCAKISCLLSSSISLPSDAILNNSLLCSKISKSASRVLTEASLSPNLILCT